MGGGVSAAAPPRGPGERPCSGERPGSGDGSGPGERPGPGERASPVTVAASVTGPVPASVPGSVTVPVLASAPAPATAAGCEPRRGARGPRLAGEPRCRDLSGLAPSVAARGSRGFRDAGFSLPLRFQKRSAGEPGPRALVGPRAFARGPQLVARSARGGAGVPSCRWPHACGRSLRSPQRAGTPWPRVLAGLTPPARARSSAARAEPLAPSPPRPHASGSVSVATAPPSTALENVSRAPSTSACPAAMVRPSPWPLAPPSVRKRCGPCATRYCG